MNQEWDGKKEGDVQDFGPYLNTSSDSQMTKTGIWLILTRAGL